MTVWITYRSEKYHNSPRCASRQSETAAKPVTAKAAEHSGYEPCGICHPPEPPDMPEPKAELIDDE